MKQTQWKISSFSIVLKGSSKGIEFGIQLSTDNNTNFNFLKFRNILISSPELVEKYNEVKLNAKNLHENEYRTKKYEFIEEVLSSNA